LISSESTCFIFRRVLSLLAVNPPLTTMLLKLHTFIFWNLIAVRRICRGGQGGNQYLLPLVLLLLLSSRHRRAVHSLYTARLPPRRCETKLNGIIVAQEIRRLPVDSQTITAFKVEALSNTV